MTSAVFLEVLVSLSIQIGLLVLVVSWITKLTNPEALKCKLWAGCHLVILGLTLRGFLLPRPRLFQPAPHLTPSTTLDIVLWQQQFGLAVLTLWLIGLGYSLTIFIVRWYQAHRFLKTCEPIQDTAFWDKILRDSQDFHELETLPRLYVSPSLQSPFCWQVHRPYIVIPEFLLDFDPDELRLVLRHELEHLQTGHPLTLFIQRLVEIVYWFHPMVWWASRQAADTREFACDDAAVSSRKEIVNYLKSLLKIVERADEETDTRSIDLAFGRGRSMLTRRATRLVILARNGLAETPSLESPRRFSWVLANVPGLIAFFVWAPIDFTAPSGSHWSPWPTWSANVLHTFGIHARDYDVNDFRYHTHELLEERGQGHDFPMGDSNP
ncbi:MAG: M56 family metallopeptidase [Planctomycetaceae bacterium]|nr:M56 family metallopeptidase [Planctomycetaceae bacterium]